MTSACACAGCWLVSVLLLYLRPVMWRAAQFRTPCTPLFPCLGILTNIFLIASLGATAYIRFGVWLLISVAFYMFYSVHNSPATPGQYSGVYDVELIENRGGVDEEPLPKSFGNQFEATMHGKAGAGTHSRSPQSSNPSSLGVDIR